jgi:hypothetical protein
VDKAYVAIQNRKTGKWLHANGKFGAYQRVRVDLSQTQAGTKWSFAVRLHKGAYGVASIVQNSAGAINASPRPWHTFTVKARHHHATGQHRRSGWWRKLRWW